ncbi:titin-like [Penaeus japonicus]|uniref:titin-like n=1 Tax=Penaeus japonicus TaxID=27405 RepID=UPI001C7171A2|nr:titin-like [Penaeus japonicus]
MTPVAPICLARHLARRRGALPTPEGIGLIGTPGLCISGRPPMEGIRLDNSKSNKPLSLLQVSWLKKDEDHLLTAGGQVYSSESKYSVSHARHLKLWELSVRDVRFSDAGLYECQLTTHPPTSTFFTLKVVEARAVIQGEPEMHVHTGVRLRLHCAVEHATEPPVYIFWFHNGSMINYTPRRRFKVMEHNFGTSLVITNVTWEDAGDYRCEPYLAIPTNVTLHVVAGTSEAIWVIGVDRSPFIKEDTRCR